MLLVNIISHISMYHKEKLNTWPNNIQWGPPLIKAQMFWVLVVRVGVVEYM